MHKLLSGNIITLRPATKNDKRSIFEWLTNSNLTKEMLGPPNFPEAKIPSWEEFDTDFADFYFDCSQPLMGQCFIIVCKENDVGQINYNEINITKKTTSLDIWLSDVKYTGKGIGTEAIQLMCEYLKAKFGCELIEISPSKRNKKAIGAYEKAGFIMTDIKLDESDKDYFDNVVLVKKMS